MTFDEPLAKTLDQLKPKGYVYFILSPTNEVLYVGTTGNLGERLRKGLKSAYHKDLRDNAYINSYRYIEVDLKDRFKVERYFIHKYQPPYNIQEVNNPSENKSRLEK